ncbi:MAG: 50S ribosomal protein L17 [Candidatus Obscuribacterales bacterium]|nr:50S ribosomal protein L17 [Candidatus Obscuribacterales bacterium]
MRHRQARHKLGRPQDQRKAVLRSLATELLRHEEIITTLAKAKALRPEVEKLITKGKKGYLDNYESEKEKAKKGDADSAKKVARSVHLRRQVGATLYDRDVVTRVFNEIAPRYLERQGGYTRIIKYHNRRGDNTPLAVIQLV